MSLACLSTESRLTAALAGQATEAERLRLEEHLQGCAACREKQGAFEALRRLRSWEPPTLSAGAEARVQQAVLAAAAATPGAARARAARAGRDRPPQRWVAWVSVGTVTACAMLAAAPALPNRRLPEPPLAWVQPPRGGPASGRVGVDGVMRAGPDGKVTLPGAVVAITGDAEARWQASARRIDLGRGALEVDAPPSAVLGVEVATAAFRARTAGARFRATPDGVETASGLVAVYGADGAQLATVAAGQRWHAPAGAGRPAARPR